MIEYIEVDRNGIVYCPTLHDGRLEKIRVKGLDVVVVVCEECELIWESVEDIVLNNPCSASTIREYVGLHGIDIPPLNKAADWNSYIERKGYLLFKEIEAFLDGITVHSI